MEEETTPFQYVNNDGYCVFRVVRTSLIMLFMTPLLYFWLLWLKLLFKNLWNQGRNPELIFAVRVYIQKSPHGCFHNVKFLQMGSLKVNTCRRLCLSTSRLVIKSQGKFCQLYIFVDFSCSQFLKFLTTMEVHFDYMQWLWWSFREDVIGYQVISTFC